ncbi:substrate-binding domain-containing protein [Vibrio viridaestus]|uniref:LacI family DNA-binding transcriptional regulator n=1 Tax=Vibrio viridaestus TaxID=2487322 RepID=A0A3N9TBD3_9VIBR|nr:substrate-binding domain-containing protein [Vibrio viridaestus]RQW61270.1 LacI family DNA-binding transcriptional regulator [Vibrio viridaestus]
MSTIKDVAKEAGVSIATVSRVINKSPQASQAAIKSVTEAMGKLGYRPNAAAKALVSQNTNTVGVLVGDVSDPFFGSLIKAIDTVAHKHGKHTLIGNGHHDEKQEREAIELLINNRCDAFVIHSKALPDEELIAYANEVKSMVLINRHIDAIADRCISLDNFKGAYLATQYLIRHGHTKIAYASSNHDIEDTAERIEGYKAALRDNGIELPGSYIDYGSPSGEGGEEAMTNLLTKSVDMTGIVCYNDNMAAGILSMAHDNGIAVPEKLSIIGFDDVLIARYVYPRLTTVRYPIEMMAEKAITLALKLANDEYVEPEQLRFSPTVVRRESVVKLAE